MGRRLYRALWLLLGGLLLAGPSAGQSVAQGERACPPMVLAALSEVSESCAVLGRDEACYGHSLVEASFHTGEGSDFAFDQPADRVSVAALQTLRTFPLDESQDIWGVAVMNVQANLPDTLPGQAVRFILYGDVALENAGGQGGPLGDPCLATSTAAANMRSGPGQQYNVVSSVGAGTDLAVEGRNEDGSWLFVRAGGQPGWMAAALLAPACDLMADVPLYDPAQTARDGPMQAFYFNTGLGGTTCREAPPSSLVIQSPQGYTVALHANGVDIALSSTAALTATRGGSMRVSTLQGRVVVSVGGRARLIPAGFASEVPLGGEDGLTPEGDFGPPEFIEEEEWLALENLPEGTFESEIDPPEMDAWADEDAFCADPANADLCTDPFFQDEVVDCGDPASADVCEEVLGVFEQEGNFSDEGDLDAGADVEGGLPPGCDEGVCMAAPEIACQCELCGVECPFDLPDEGGDSGQEPGDSLDEALDDALDGTDDLGGVDLGEGGGGFGDDTLDDSFDEGSLPGETDFGDGTGAFGDLNPPEFPGGGF